MNIRGLRSNLVECEYFLESNSTDILALCETKFDDWTGFVNFSVPDYLSLFWKDSITHISCSLCEGGASFCTGLISRKLCRFLLMFSTSVTLLSVWLFFLYWSPSSSWCTVFDAISSHVDEVLSISPSANVFVFENV